MDGLGEAARRIMATTADPELHLLVDGVALQAARGDGETARFAVPAGARTIRIRSRSAIPAESGLTADVRRLGVHVLRIVMTAADAALEVAGCHAALIDGWHDPEGKGRWTDGDALLPDSLFAGIVGPFEVVLQVARTDLRYPVEPPRPAPRAVAAAPPDCDARAGVALASAAMTAAEVHAFVREAMSFAARLIPGLRLHIYAGGAALPPVGGAGIEIHPGPADLAAALDRHRVLVIPAGATDAAAQALADGLASGIAAIASPSLADALGLAHEREILVAADHTEFAMALARLHGDAVLWRRLSAAGRAWSARRWPDADSPDA
jgi:hypothetical protein